MEALHGVGAECSQVADGDQALAVLEDPSERIDLVCLDGVIPRASSGQVVERARELRPGLPIVVCSGYVEADLARRGLRTAELSLLPKPFSRAQLLSCVVECLQRSGRGAIGAEPAADRRAGLAGQRGGSNRSA